MQKVEELLAGNGARPADTNVAREMLLTRHGPSLDPDLLHRALGALNGTPFKVSGLWLRCLVIVLRPNSYIKSEPRASRFWLNQPRVSTCRDRGRAASEDAITGMLVLS